MRGCRKRAPQADQSKRARKQADLASRPRPSVAQLECRRNIALSCTAAALALSAVACAVAAGALL